MISTGRQSVRGALHLDRLVQAVRALPRPKVKDANRKVGRSDRKARAGGRARNALGHALGLGARQEICRKHRLEVDAVSWELVGVAVPVLDEALDVAGDDLQRSSLMLRGDAWGYRSLFKGFAISDTVYGSVLCLLTGLHAIHALIGSGFFSCMFIKKPLKSKVNYDRTLARQGGSHASENERQAACREMAHRLGREVSSHACDR